MQYASSIKYGGLLIAAEDCNYNSYRSLALICPFCKESIFLVSGHERHYVKIDKITNVISHFSHRSDKDKQEVKQCEFRSAKISQSDITERETVAKNQRLKLFNRHLWNIFRLCYKLDNFEETEQFVERSFKSVPLISPIGNQQTFVDLLSKVIYQEVDRIHAEAEDFLTALIQKTEDNQFVSQENLQSVLAIWRQSIDRKMHIKIYNEVIDCLVQKKHLPILQKLIVVGLYNFIGVTTISENENLSKAERVRLYNRLDFQDLLNSQDVTPVIQLMMDSLLYHNNNALEAVASFVRDDILEIIALTPWIEGFNKFN